MAIDITSGSLRVAEAKMIHRGQEIPIEQLEIEVSSSESEEISVFATAHTKAKVLGLSPGSSELKVILEWEGQLYEITETTVFDLDIHVTGEMDLQLTGKLRPHE